MKHFGLIFLFFIPALIALGNDCYLFYEYFASKRMVTLDLILAEFKFSALGFIWTNYSLESYKTVVQSVDPETWASIDSFLTLKATYLGLGFGAAMTLLFTVLGFFAIGPFTSEATKTKNAERASRKSFKKKV